MKYKKKAMVINVVLRHASRLKTDKSLYFHCFFQTSIRLLSLSGIELAVTKTKAKMVR